MKRKITLFQKLEVERLEKRLKVVEAKLAKVKARIAELNGNAPPERERELHSCSVYPATPTTGNDVNVATMINH